MSKKPITPKRQAFVQAYLVHLNGSQAVRDAGFKTNRPDALAYELLRKPEIQAAIQVAMDARAKRTEITQDKVLQEIANTAFLDPLDLFQENGTLKPLNEMPENARRAIAGIEVEEIFDGSGKDRVWMGYLKKIKLVSKEGMVTLAGKHLKMFTDKTEVSGPNGGPQEHQTVLIIQGVKPHE